MRIKTTKDFVITKKNHTYTISDKNSGKRLYNIMDVSVYDNFNLDKPLLSGLGSMMNVSGNYYSFKSIYLIIMITMLWFQIGKESVYIL